MQLLYTAHASRARADRGVSAEEVEECVRFPEVRYISGPRYPRDTQVVQRGDLAVVIKPLPRGDVRIITILWRHEEQWTTEQMKGRR